MKKTVVVLGAGITGLTAAYTLVKKGFAPVVLEKNSFAGGLAATFAYKKYLLDFGPHNLHTHIPEVIPFIQNELGLELRRMPIKFSKIYFNGALVNYPLSIADALKKINFATSFRCFIDYLIARTAIKLKPAAAEESFEDWVKSRFGKHFYELFFGPYARKVWGISAHELDVVIARKRIAEPSLLALLARSILGIRIGRKHPEDPQAIISYYPAGGIGRLSSELAGRIESGGGRIELNAEVEDIVLSGPRLRYRRGGIAQDLKWDYLINTIPLDSFYGLASDVTGGEAADSAAALGYRSVIFLYLVLAKDKVTDYPWVYFNDTYDEGLIFNRMYEIGNFDREMIDGQKGVVCLEITCYKDDALWNTSDGELFEQAIGYLEKHGFLGRRDVTEVFTRRVGQVYPVFRKDYARHLMKVLGHLQSYGTIVSLGRQGLFAYANIDHCIAMGLMLEKLIEGNSINAGNFVRAYDHFIFH